MISLTAVVLEVVSKNKCGCFLIGSDNVQLNVVRKVSVDQWNNYTVRY